MNKRIDKILNTLEFKNEKINIEDKELCVKLEKLLMYAKQLETARYNYLYILQEIEKYLKDNNIILIEDDLKIFEMSKSIANIE